MTPRFAALIAVSTTALLVGLPAQAQSVDFGDDSSAWANDGECDDPRFTGEGMASSTVAADQMRDASDCRAAFEAGRIQLIDAQQAGTTPPLEGTTPPVEGTTPPVAGTTPPVEGTTPPAQGTKPQPEATTPPAQVAGSIDFGDDSSDWANDGECDDPRFVGEGTAAVTTEADRMRDASDCRAAYEAGTVQLAEGEAAPTTPTTPEATTPEPTAPDQTAPTTPTTPASIDFGDDSSEWANDGECDDRRFVGQGMATSIGWANVGRDATDCRGLYDRGSIRVWNILEAQAATQCSAISFGDDTGEFPNDGECDDIRFEGLASASGLREANAGKDASDCMRLCAYGLVSLRDY